MKIKDKILLISVFVILSVITVNAKMWVAVGKDATNTGAVTVACSEDNSEWQGYFSTNVSGLTVIWTEALPMGGIKPDPEFSAEQVSLRILDSAENCREAIFKLSDILENAPVGSTYATLSVADDKEAWIFEYAGKGKESGAVWAALRVPDDKATVFTGAALIHKLPEKDLRNCLYSLDIQDYARKLGKFAGSDAEFDFAKVFAPKSYLSGFDAGQIYNTLRIRDVESNLWGMPSMRISCYDLRKALRIYENCLAKYSFIVESNGSKSDYLKTLTYFALGNPNISTFIPLFRAVKKLPEEIGPESVQSSSDLLSKTLEVSNGSRVAKDALREMQLMLEDSIAVDVSVAYEQLPDFNDEEIAVELLQDLADIWAKSVKTNYVNYCRDYKLKVEQDKE